MRTSLAAQRVKRLPATREPRVRSLGWEDPLGKEMAAHSRTLAWRSCAGPLLLHGLFSSCSEQGLPSHCGAWASHCRGFFSRESRVPGEELRWLRCLGSVLAVARLWHTGSVVVAQRLSRCTACGVFPGRGSSPCPWPWRADSYPLYPQGISI